MEQNKTSVLVSRRLCYRRRRQRAAAPLPDAHWDEMQVRNRFFLTRKLLSNRLLAVGSALLLFFPNDKEFSYQRNSANSDNDASSIWTNVKDYPGRLKNNMSFKVNFLAFACIAIDNKLWASMATVKATDMRSHVHSLYPRELASVYQTSFRYS